jgi:hypothetical protein
MSDVLTIEEGAAQAKVQQYHPPVVVVGEAEGRQSGQALVGASSRSGGIHGSLSCTAPGGWRVL